MFNHNPHNDIWQKLQQCLKRGDNEGAVDIWRQALPTLAAHYDDLRMLYYVGRQGQRDAYRYACSTLTYLKDSPAPILRARLGVFRYAAEQSSHGHVDVSRWMIADLAAALGSSPEHFPPAAAEVPKAIAEQIEKLRAATVKS